MKIGKILAIAVFLATSSAGASTGQVGCLTSRPDVPELVRKAVNECEFTFVKNIEPVLIRIVESYNGVKLIADDATPICLTTVADVTSSTMNFSNVAAQSFFAMSNSDTVDLKLNINFYHNIMLQQTLINKGEVISPLGKVITPGSSTEVIKRFLNSQIDFSLVNPKTQEVLMNQDQLYQILLNEFMSDHPPLGSDRLLDIETCDFTFPVIETPAN